VPVRVVAATNRDLRAEAESGRFREDFFYRLAAYEIILPPLRERRSDIALLVEHFRRRYQEGADSIDVQPATSEVLDILNNHAWPGNVRELEHIVQRAIVDSGSLADPQVIRSLLAGPGEGRREETVEPGIGADMTLKELEKRHIEAVLRRCQGNRTRAAGILGIERKSLYRKAKRLGITLDAEEDES
jgi:DNA-binding NtrC family response regulator